MAKTFKIRDYQVTDIDRIAEMNQSEIPHVSPITHEALIQLIDETNYLRVAEFESGEIAAFLLALDETGNYASPNFQWFKSRYPKFCYVDRIIVSSKFQGAGLGRRLYADLEIFVGTRAPVLTCEVNLNPPNPASISFHQRLGFREVGVQDTEGGKKTVSLMIKELRV